MEHAMKMTFKTGTLLLSILTIAAISFAQNADSKSSSMLTAAPPPQPELQSLTKALAGKWTTTYEFVAGVMSPGGGKGTGEEVWRVGPGGYVLIEEEHVLGPDQEMFLIAFHWWDKSTNSLRGMLCNNSGPASCNIDSYFNSTLNWDGKQLVIEMRFPQGAKKMVWHEVWSDITPTSFTQTGDMGEVGGPLKRAVTIHGTKNR
jgi:hypothetical protein